MKCLGVFTYPYHFLNGCIHLNAHGGWTVTVRKPLKRSVERQEKKRMPDKTNGMTILRTVRHERHTGEMRVDFEWKTTISWRNFPRESEREGGREWEKQLLNERQSHKLINSAKLALVLIYWRKLLTLLSSQAVLTLYGGRTQLHYFQRERTERRAWFYAITMRTRARKKRNHFIIRGTLNRGQDLAEKLPRSERNKKRICANASWHASVVVWNRFHSFFTGG